MFFNAKPTQLFELLQIEVKIASLREAMHIISFFLTTKITECRHRGHKVLWFIREAWWRDLSRQILLRRAPSGSRLL